MKKIEDTTQDMKNAKDTTQDINQHWAEISQRLKWRKPWKTLKEVNFDFFSVEKNPTANFKITKVEAAKNGTVTIFGDMTIKGIKQAISFPATVKADKKDLTANAKITLDRTKWDIRYGSKTFFENIGDKAIYDDFVIDLALVAAK